MLLTHKELPYKIKHELKVSYFTEKRDNINVLQRDLKVLEKRLSEYTHDKTNDFNIDKKMELIDEINSLKSSIEEIESIEKKLIIYLILVIFYLIMPIQTINLKTTTKNK